MDGRQTHEQGLELGDGDLALRPCYVIGRAVRDTLPPPVPAIIFVSDDNTLSRNVIVCQDRLGTKTRMIGHRRRFSLSLDLLPGPWPSRHVD